MNTVQTEVEVANLALDMVKEAPVVSLNENRAAARWMKRNFWVTVDTVTIMQKWKFAMRRAELPADATPPAFEWKFRYRKPTDCLRVLHLRTGATLNGRLIPHEVEGDFILTNAPAPLRIKYIRRVDNMAEWPPLFVEAVAAKLASGICHFMTGKQSMAELTAMRFQQALQVAASIDAAEGSNADQYATAYDDARYYHYMDEY